MNLFESAFQSGLLFGQLTLFGAVISKAALQNYTS
jgi:hypothetical protein